MINILGNRQQCYGLIYFSILLFRAYEIFLIYSAIHREIIITQISPLEGNQFRLASLLAGDSVPLQIESAVLNHSSDRLPDPGWPLSKKGWIEDTREGLNLYMGGFCLQLPGIEHCLCPELANTRPIPSRLESWATNDCQDGS